MNCSAFQIRYGGYKGMLVIDPTLKDVDIVFRESMKKFDSPKNTYLEIAKTSAPVRLMLNRPFITILDDLKTDRVELLRLQEEMLRNLIDMLIVEECAAEYLHSKLPNCLFNVKDIAGSGIGLNTEPFYRSLLLALHRHSIDNLKRRANIDIDPGKGRNMLGVLDETGRLQYGEVFVQYTTDINFGETGTKTTIRRGTVMVTKNPCMYAGDVRKFTAVDIPELHHIVDCIVFPQNGHRPHPNEMAGSDLDGDEYAVLWDENLIFTGPNAPPAHFPSCPAPEIPNVTDCDMIDFLSRYIRNDQVGAIASAHLAFADKEGILSSTCQRIAKKFCIAVDFPKTGAESVNFHLLREERPQVYPNFMEKHWKVTSKKTEKALGKLYKMCKDFETENQHASLNYHHVQVDSSLIFEGWEKYRASAIQSRNKYNYLLGYILQNHGVLHEAEAFSGAFTKLHCRYYERKDKTEVEKVVVSRIKTLYKKMKEEFLEEFEAEFGDANEKNLEMLRKASAWYIVTYQDQNPTFLSFPWIVSNFLIDIKVRSHSPLCLFTPLVFKLDSEIMESASKNLLPSFPPVAKEMFEDYFIHCSEETLISAFRFVISWATDYKIIRDRHEHVKGFMFFRTLVSIFLFVAEREGYVSQKGKIPTQLKDRENKNAGVLFLSLLRHCSKLNFCKKAEALKILPFDVYKSKRLGKMAMQTYHQIAIKGSYPTYDKESKSGSLEMKEEFVDCSDIWDKLNPDVLQKIEKTLQVISEVEVVSLRPNQTTKKIIVSAEGTQQSINLLRSLIQKGSESFSTIIGGSLADSEHLELYDTLF